MLRPGQTLRVSFTCVDSTGAATSPTGTPTATLYRNGTSQGDTVTVTMSGAQGIASVAIPSGWSQGDAVFLEISATVSGTSCTVRSQSVYLSNLPAVAGDQMTLTSAYDAAKTASLDAAGVRTAVGLASANLDTQLANVPANVRTNLATELARIDAAITTRLATASYSAPLDAAGVRTAVGLASANLDTQLTNVPANVRTNLATELGRIDATISSRSSSSELAAVQTHGDTNWGGSADLTDIETALDEINASLAQISGAGLPSAGGGVDPAKLSYVVGQVVAKTITLSANPAGNVTVTWEKYTGANVATTTVSASSTSISVENPSELTTVATSGRWSVRNSVGTELAAGTFEVAETAR